MSVAAPPVQSFLLKARFASVKYLCFAVAHPLALCKGLVAKQHRSYRYVYVKCHKSYHLQRSVALETCKLVSTDHAHAGYGPVRCRTTAVTDKISVRGTVRKDLIELFQALDWCLGEAVGTCICASTYSLSVRLSIEMSQILIQRISQLTFLSICSNLFHLGLL